MDILKQVYKKYLYRVFIIVIARNRKQKSLNWGLTFLKSAVFFFIIKNEVDLFVLRCEVLQDL